MDMIALTATARTKEKTAKAICREGLVPCVVYGNEAANTTIQCVYNEIYKAYAQAGESTLVELDMEGNKIPVLFHELAFDPVTDRMIHVDFYAVNMKKEIDASVPLHFVGEAPAVKNFAGIFLSTHDHVTVTCLPANLPHELIVDVSSLENLGDTLHVSDIKVPNGVKIEDDPELMIATVQEPRKEEVEEPVAATETAEGGAAAKEGEAKKEGEGEKA